VEFPLSEWVEAKIKGKFYESNRYDIKLYDSLMRKTISVYLYMDEDSSEILAIDAIVLDVNNKASYAIKETPFGDMLEHILKL